MRIAAVGFILIIASCASGVAPQEVGLDASLGEIEQRAVDSALTFEQLVRECMLEAGFEYRNSGGPSSVAPLFSEDGLSEAEYAAEFGFGFSTTIEERTIVRVGETFGLVDRDRSPLDANRSELEQLSESEREAWWMALQGFAPGDAPLPTAGGCIGSASSLAGAPDVELLEQLAELEALIAADPRSLQLDQRWSSCMTQSGWDYPNARRVRADFFERYEAALGATSPAGIEELQESERRAAVASLECEAGLARDRSSIRAEYEEDFELP